MDVNSVVSEINLDANKSCIDLSNAIKENLEMENCVPVYILNDLIKNADEQLDIIFQALELQLNEDEVVIFGRNLLESDLKADSVINHFMKHLLLSKVPQFSFALTLNKPLLPFRLV